VPTADNAADDATRSQYHVKLSQKSRWLGGPAFLKQPAGSWPQPESGLEQGLDINDAEEASSEFALVAANNFCISFQRSSSYSQLLRTTAWVIRFTRRCRR